jgi:RimJ/RimL family protein N-acetyltransferase
VIVAETARLRLRTIVIDDAPFYLELVNDPAFIEHIGDRGLRTLEDARRALVEGPITMQREYGHSLYLVERKIDGAAIGMCGLIKRDTLEDVDIGYAFLPAFRGCGYAFEAAQAVLAHAATLGIVRLAAITSPANVASNQLLRKLGLRFQRVVHLMPDGQESNLYLCDLPAAKA